MNQHQLITTYHLLYFSRCILLLITLFASTVYATEETEAQSNFTIAPDFETVTLSGEQITLSKLTGEKPVYLFFWATWCPICKREIPRLKAFYQEFGNEIELIAINVGINDTLKNVEKYQKKFGLPYNLAFDDHSTISQLYGVYGTPTQVIIDIDGHIRYQGHRFPRGLEHMIPKLATPKH